MATVGRRRWLFGPLSHGGAAWECRRQGGAAAHPQSVDSLDSELPERHCPYSTHSFPSSPPARAEQKSPGRKTPSGWGGAAAGSVGFLFISRKNVWWSHPLVILVFKRMLFGEKRLCFLSNIIPSLESCDIKILPPLSFFLALPHGLFNFTTNYLTKIKGYM